MSRNDPFNTGTSGGRDRDAEQGTARVETRLTGSQGRSDEGGLGATGRGHSDEGMVDRVTDRARDTANQARNRLNQWGEEAEEQVREWGNDAREQVDELSEQARGWASRARNEVGDVLERAENRLEEQTGAVTFVRENPLLAAGLAFGVGFLLAGSDGGGRKRRGLVGRASGSLRSAVVGGISTMLMQELQEMMDEHGGPAGLLGALTGRGSDSEERNPQNQQW